MEHRILLKKLAGRLAISVGRMLKMLVGALSVIGEDTVIAAYQHGEHAILVKIPSFG
jgi:hypothetical protein